jgi:hypothetical protein
MRACIRLGGAPLLLALAGCAGAVSELQAMSTSFVGCPPGEIAISRRAVGLGTWTWEASCRGRTYHCALQGQIAPPVLVEDRFALDVPGGGAVTESGTKYAQPETAPVARCEIDPSSAPPPPPPPSPPKADPLLAVTPSPEGAAGYTFGADVKVAQVACRDAGHTWTELEPGHPTCSGAPVAVGFPASCRIELCAGQRICGIVLDAAGDAPGFGELLARFAKLKTTLEAKYGSNRDLRTRPLPDCREPVERCLATGRLRSVAAWKWANGTEVALILEGGAPDGRPALRIEYHQLRAKGASASDGL